MQSYLLVFALISSFGAVKAQKVSNIDFDEIKRSTENPASPYYYPKQLKRLQAGDTSLQHADYRYLYYGRVFNAGYNPYHAADISEKFTKVFDNGDYNHAVPLGEKELLEHPFNLALVQKLKRAHNRTGDREAGHALAQRYLSFLQVILESGDGHSPATAFVPVAIDDEKAVLRHFNLKQESQTLTGTTDVLTVVPDPDIDTVDDEPHVFAGSKMYFDASRALLFLKASGGK